MVGAAVAALEINTERRDDGATVVALVGELDLVNASSLERELESIEAKPSETLIVDLRGISFIDSTGLRAVIAADQRARAGDRRLVVVAGAPAVDRLFSVTQLEQRLDIVDDPDSVSGSRVSRD
jgi:anti-sigma B factor antagonist